MTASTRRHVITEIVKARGWTLLDEVQIAMRSDDFFVLVKIPESGERWTRIDIPVPRPPRQPGSVASFVDHVIDIFDHVESRIAKQRDATKRWSPYPWSPHP